MSSWVRGAALAIWLLVPAAAPAWWGGHARSPATSSYYASYPYAYSSYYVPVYQPPVYYAAPVSPAPTVEVCPQGSPAATATPAPTYAQPTAAPPSATPAMPSTNPASPERPIPPAVSESRSFFDAYPVARRESDKPPGDRCQVGFWNLSGQDLTLKVDGQSLPLAQGKNLRLDLGRQFVWRVNERKAQSQQVPSAESALDIIIRR